MLIKNKLSWTVFILIAVLASCSPRIMTNSKFEEEIFCYLEIQSDTVKICEGVSMQFVILNKSDEEIYVNNRPYGFYVNGVKKGGFDITVQNAKGEFLEESDVVSMYSGKYGITKIAPGEACKIGIDFSKYMNIEDDERYRVYVRKEFPVYLDKKKETSGENHKDYKRFVKLIRRPSISFYVLP